VPAALERFSKRRYGLRAVDLDYRLPTFGAIGSLARDVVDQQGVYGIAGRFCPVSPFRHVVSRLYMSPKGLHVA
jgi:hypothetical protein